MLSQQLSNRLLYRFLSIGLVLWCLSICSTTQITAAETVKIQATDSTATEGTTADVGLFTVSRATATATPLTVYLTPSGTATAGVDYGAIPSSVVIPASATSVTIYVHAIDDVIAETSETVIVTIATNAAYTIGSPSNATVNVRDNEPTEISISASDATATEPGTNTGTFTITRKGLADQVVYVPLTYSGTAVPIDDYKLADSVAYLAPWSATRTVLITPLDDAVLEFEETVIAKIEPSTAYRITGTATATVKIADNEATVITVSASDAAAAETGGNTGTFKFERQGNFTAAITVNYTIGGNAIAGSDYTALSGTVVLAANVASALVTVTPIDDTVKEGQETIIATVTAGSGYVPGSANSATVTLSENEQSVAIVATDSIAFEPGTDKGTFTVTRYSTDVTLALVVNYTVSGTATSGSDFTALSGSVTIAANASTATVTVTPVNNSTAEPAETVIVTLTPSSNYAITGSAATVNIGDNDSVLPVLVVYGGNVLSESTGAGISFQIYGDVNLTSPMTVNYIITGTATAGLDFEPIAGSAIIEANNSSIYLPITFIDDNVTEGQESITLTLISNGFYQVGSPNTATININDNDSSLVSLTVSDATASEPGYTKGTGTVLISRLGDTSTALTIPLMVTGTATAGLDYVLLSPTITIPAGDVSATVTLQALDDTTAESDETVILSLQNGVGYKLASSWNGTVTIQDDEPVLINIIASDALAGEGGSDTGTMQITRLGRRDTALTIPLTRSGSATSGSDFTALPASVTLAANSLTASVIITPINDSLNEAPETVIVTLGSGSGYSVGTPASAAVTIIDDEPAVSLAIIDLYAREGGSPGAIAVSRTGSLAAALTVNLSTSGNAIAGTHYQALPTSVIFPINVSQIIIPVNAINDAVWRPETMVQLSINTGAYALGSPSSVTVLMVDNDNVPPSVVVQMQTPNQSSTTLTLDASGTTDANSDPLTYRWSIYGAGVLSTTAQLTYDFKLLAGQIIELVVSDGKYSVTNYYPVLYVDTDTAIASGDIAWDQGVLIVDNATLTLAGAHEYLVGRIINGGNITHEPSTITKVNSLNILIKKQLFIDSTSQINVTGKGLPMGVIYTPFGVAYAPASYTYSGGSHGGYGVSHGSTDVANEVYGAFDNPTTVGSGGGYLFSSGASGGGLIKLKAETLSLNGGLYANGQDGSGYAGGAGGGINLDLGSLIGTGPIQAQGGNCSNGSGGGGRIAVRYVSGTIPQSSLSVTGGFGGSRSAPSVADYYAGAGTIFLQKIGQSTSTLISDNKFTVAVPSSMVIPTTPWYFGVRNISNDDPSTFSGTIKVLGGANMIVDNTPTTITWKTGSTVDRSRLQTRAILAETWTMSNQSDVTVSTLTAQSITLSTGSILRSFTTTTTTLETLFLNITSSVTIDATSKIDVTARGCPNGYRWTASGPVAQDSAMTYAGGSYGGYGIDHGDPGTPDKANELYGSYFDPNETGSGGGKYVSGGNGIGGAGGGLVRISANTLVLNGTIKANGQDNLSDGDPYYISGSGGGIRLSISSFTGTGTIRADGGGGINCPGGGGRIAIYYTSGLIDFTKISAYGGYQNRASPQVDYAKAGAGTVFVQKSGDVYGTLRFDNGGIDQTRPSLLFVGAPFATNGTQPVPPVDILVEVLNGASYVLNGDMYAFDSDRDGLTSWEEQAAGTNPRDFDSNDNGLSDGIDLEFGQSPLVLDTDGDGISNTNELALGSDPLGNDTDGDGIVDGVDVFPTDPTASTWPTPSPTDATPPVITIVSPAGIIKLN